MSTFGSGLMNLKELQMSCCRVTDAGIAHLKGRYTKKNVGSNLSIWLIVISELPFAVYLIFFFKTSIFEFF